MTPLLAAIYSKFSGSALETALTGGLHLSMAPQTVSEPYGVYILVSGVPEYTFDTVHESVVIQFSFYSDSSSYAEVSDLFELCKDLYDDCKLSMSGYRSVGMERELWRLIRDNDDRTWSYIVQYRILIEKL